MDWIIPAGRGTRHTNTWAAGERPKTPREGITYLYPNGVPLTALLSMMKSQKPKDAEFSDYTKSFPLQMTDVAGVYDAPAMLVPLVAGAYGVGKILYVKPANVPAGACENFVKECRVNHVIELRKDTDMRAAISGDVVEAVENGANSYIVMRTIEAAGAAETKNPAVCNRVAIITSAQEEGALMQDEVNYNAVKMWNYCQIVETDYSVTNTQLETELITGDALRSEKKEKHEIHGQMLERMFWFGRRYEKVVNGKPKRYSMGVIPMIQEYVPGNIHQFHLDPLHAGEEWIEGGMEWFDDVFEAASHWGSSNRDAFCGSGARVGLTQLLRANGVVQLDAHQVDFGIWVERWSHNGISLRLMTNPLFSHEPSMNHAMCILEMRNLQEKPLRQTRVVKRPAGIADGIKEAWLTETGLYFTRPPEFRLLNGIGKNSIV